MNIGALEETGILGLARVVAVNADVGNDGKVIAVAVSVVVGDVEDDIGVL